MEFDPFKIDAPHPPIKVLKFFAVRGELEVGNCVSKCLPNFSSTGGYPKYKNKSGDKRSGPAPKSSRQTRGWEAAVAMMVFPRLSVILGSNCQ